MREIIAPEVANWKEFSMATMFIGGSIDNGAAEDWQAAVVKKYSDLQIAFVNPRRAMWNPDASDEEVRAQITWELDALDDVDSIVIYFHPQSKAPVALLELGLYATSKKITVICPPEFWRATNVEMVCTRLKIPFYTDLNLGMNYAANVAMTRFKARTHG